MARRFWPRKRQNGTVPVEIPPSTSASARDTTDGQASTHAYLWLSRPQPRRGGPLLHAERSFRREEDEIRESPKNARFPQ
uniref:Uncharacterized protein n=2 Tax=Oryza TaxID=4527 RepID=A0A0E0NJ75_ORYRU